jgi:VanZ family protein
VLKKLSLFVAIFYAIALATVSLITIKNMPDVELSYADKIVHFLAYCIFTALWYLAFSRALSIKKKKAIFNAVIFAIVFGIVIEVLQGTVTTTRASDIYDVFANTAGALLVSLIIWLKHELGVKNN